MKKFTNPILRALVILLILSIQEDIYQYIRSEEVPYGYVYLGLYFYYPILIFLFVSLVIRTIKFLKKKKVNLVLLVVDVALFMFLVYQSWGFYFARN